MTATSVSGPGALARAVGALTWPAVLLWCLAWMLPPVLGGLLLILATLVLSAAVHEVGHALAYWYVVTRRHGVRLGTPAAELTLHGSLGLATAITPAVPLTDRAVIAAGPLLPALLGTAVVAGNALVGGPFAATLVGGTLAFHALGLLPGNDDGDRLWSLA